MQFHIMSTTLETAYVPAKWTLKTVLNENASAYASISNLFAQYLQTHM